MVMVGDGNGNAEALLLVTTWLLASMTYVRFSSTLIRPGKFRLLALLPSIILLPFLPWYFSSTHLRPLSAFFLVWLTAFKLLLLSFGLGPLSPALPLVTFIAIASLPVKLHSAKSPPPSSVQIITKAFFLTILISLYQYKSQFHPCILLALLCGHTYLILDVVLSTVSFLSALLLGLDLEPQFKAPHKSESLQDFWGRRWNLTVTGILRPSVYNPLRALWGRDPAVMVTFLVSGLMHEIINYYVSLTWSKGEITCFFVLQGFCTLAEEKARKAGWWRPKKRLAGPMVIVFVLVTACWLFFPPLVRSGVDEAVAESLAMVRFLEDAGLLATDRLGALFGFLHGLLFSSHSL